MTSFPKEPSRRVKHTEPKSKLLPCNIPLIVTLDFRLLCPVLADQRAASTYKAALLQKPSGLSTESWLKEVENVKLMAREPDRTSQSPEETRKSQPP
jgi:hypothetical protein